MSEASITKKTAVSCVLSYSMDNELTVTIAEYGEFAQTWYNLQVYTCFNIPYHSHFHVEFVADGVFILFHALAPLLCLA